MKRENHFIYMLVALLIFLIVIPLLEDHYVFSEGVQRFVAFTCLLSVGVFSLRESNLIFRTGLALAVAGILINLLGVSPFGGSYLHSSLIALFLFLLLAIWASMKQVLFANDLSFNRIVGAICIYLLLATIWAVLYSFAELMSPGSFNGIDIKDTSDWDTRWIYFSFVTLTTLGYGDITPATNTTRVLTYTEAVFGVFYMAILVAGLVSGYLGQRNNPPDS
jgi:hypothetical protein